MVSDSGTGSAPLAPNAMLETDAGHPCILSSQVWSLSQIAKVFGLVVGSLVLFLRRFEVSVHVRNS